MGLTTKLRSPVRWGIGGVLFAGLILALGLTASAAGKGKSHKGHVPSCGQISAKEIKKTIYGDAKLHLITSKHDICGWLGHKNGHYEMAVNIYIKAGSKSLWKRIKSANEKAAAEQGATFRNVSNSNPALIEYSQIQTGDGQPPCSAHQKLPVTGPPSCSSEPAWWHQNAAAYGTIKGTHTKILVGAEVYAELGDAGINSAVDLVKHILKGKLK